jgi:hypothetical protein
MAKAVLEFAFTGHLREQKYGTRNHENAGWQPAVIQA